MKIAINKINVFRHLSFQNIKNLFFSFLSRIIFNKTNKKFLDKLIFEHISMYHQSQQSPQSCSENIAPAQINNKIPTPKQIIKNLKTFILKQEELLGHATDLIDPSEKLESLTIDEINEYHFTLSAINKLLFEDHAFSKDKVEEIALMESLEMQKELDSRGFIELNDTKPFKDEDND
jgi:hypothetical protein